MDGRVEPLPDEPLRWVHLPMAQDGPKPRMQRDLAILERQVERDPGDARAVFYLGQTHRDLGSREQAIELYERRAAMGGWDEEAFYARYQAGVLLADVDWPRAMTTLVEAWEMRPQRLEPLQALSANLRIRGAHETAHMLAARGPAVRRRRTRSSWRPGSTTGACCSSTRSPRTGSAIRVLRWRRRRALARDDLPALHREQAEHNRRAAIDEIAKASGREGARAGLSA